jgi:lipopolysaccharide biosynthesis glycosyltransferase
MIRLFAGYDQREAVGFHVFASSVIRRASAPVAITAVQDVGPTDGSNTFTYARYKVAEMCGFKGWAIFADACDMLCLGDIAELWDLQDERCAVQVVKHSYNTRNPLKYLGTPMLCRNLDYPRKNWSSLMLINCAASEWRLCEAGMKAHLFTGFSEERIGALPPTWNCLVDEGQPHEDAKLLHWTTGIPGFSLYNAACRAEDWHAEHEFMREAHV